MLARAVLLDSTAYVLLATSAIPHVVRVGRLPVVEGRKRRRRVGIAEIEELTLVQQVGSVG